MIFAIEEPRRVGFALGTVSDSVVSGEESFMLEWNDNDEVWFTVRAFDAPAALLYRLLPGLDPPPSARALPGLSAGHLAAVHDPRVRSLMGSALPLGEAVPPDGSLPAGTTIDAETPFGVYLHVPFCRVRCGYCDFNTYTSDELRGARQDQYADTLLREIDAGRARPRATRVRSVPRSTVFFGGGTPTLLPPGDLARMLGGRARHLRDRAGCRGHRRGEPRHGDGCRRR